MSGRKPSLVIKDMLNCIDHVQLYTSSISFDLFCSDFMVVEASLYNIQTIGEAVSHLPDEVKQENPHIPWALIKGMRNRLIHEYFGTDLQLVWNVIIDEFPSFKIELEKIYSQLLAESR